MAGEETTNQGNIKIEYNQGTTGMNMDNTVNQIQKGTLTYALNAAVENFDANSVNYQNEPGNEFCLQFPDGYEMIGEHAILEQNKHIFFLANPTTGGSEIGYMENNDCIYHTYINADCLNFDVHYPIHKAVHKITNCTTEIYWTDGLNPRRYLDLLTPPYTVAPGTDVCDNKTIPVINCNKLNIQPDFDIPQLKVVDVISGGSLIAGTYQFAIQYCDSIGDGYTSFYSVTNPTPIANVEITTPNFNYEVGKSIILKIENIDITGYFKYFNLAVIKTINDIPSVDLVGTYFIDKSNKKITYTGQNVTSIKLTINEIFEKFPYYEIAQDITAVQDVLVWDNLTSIDRINYQQIANQIQLGWQTYRIPDTEDYSDELNATNLRGYLRDEVYAFEIVFLLKNGKQTDGFHIPGRVKGLRESVPDVPTTNNDFIGEPDYYTPNSQGFNVGYSSYWKIYNTAAVSGYTSDYINALNGNIALTTYKGTYQFGEMGYWESNETYPCNKDVWGDLSNQPIRHHKMPDVLVSPIFQTGAFSLSGGALAPVMQSSNAIYSLGIRIDTQVVNDLIKSSNLTQDQKDNIAGFKIVRGDRGTNKSIIAKGILRNVGTYHRDNQDYYFPNYPYNDISDDPFLLANNNAYSAQSTPWIVNANYGQDVTIQYTDPNTGRLTTNKVYAGGSYEFCATSRPKSLTGKAYIGPGNYTVWNISALDCFFCGDVNAVWDDPFTSDNSPYEHRVQLLSGGPFSSAILFNLNNIPGGVNGVVTDLGGPAPHKEWNCGFGGCWGPHVLNTNVIYDRYSPLNCASNLSPTNLKNSQPQYGDRQVFNSPETSFGQPFLGTVLKLESTIFGAGKAHFVEVRNNAKYKLLTLEAQQDALQSSADLANVGGFSATAMFTAYQAYLQIYINGITRRNYAWSFNSIANYSYTQAIPNNQGKKQRNLDIAQYLIPGVQNVGDTNNINNFQRESSVYLRTPSTEYNLNRNKLEFPDYFLNSPSGTPILTDKSRYTPGDAGICNAPGLDKAISVVSYYASIKNMISNQWGQIYSYETIDTGFQIDLSTSTLGIDTVFGGDTFINRFTFKTKLPFFIDNRVGAPDDSDIFYDEIGNIAYPKYWHTARSVIGDYTISSQNNQKMIGITSYKDHKFDCPNSQTDTGAGAGSNRTFYDGFFYLFAYGIPSFYCESSYNVALRQAFNNKEGDFWPHVSTGIPDDWLQQSFVPIAQDNTYYYNVTYSKQNKENYFSHLPVDWTQQLCYTNYPFRTIYSDRQQSFSDNKVNSWLIYRPISFFDFPQNYGKLTSLDGIQNRAILARFENKSLLYNTLLTVDTSNPQAAYLGNDTLFRSAPPIDFAETDLGYVGSQNKMLLKIPQGQISIDAKRGQVFLISGNQATDLSAFGSGLNRFFTDHLAFEILRYFPNVNVDNHFNSIGLHGVYDSKFDRVIISKLDYIPLNKDIKYDSVNREFYLETVVSNIAVKTKVYLTDSEYFCNKSWTLSFNMNTKSWISFHSYIPNFYIAENNFFYSGLNGCCDDLEAIAINEVPVTTTTSSTITPTTTSTSTRCLDCKPPIPPCSLDGYVLETSCELDGIAYDLSPTTTSTTTYCVVPNGANTFTLFSGYILTGDLPVSTTNSFEDACNAVNFLSGIFPTEFEYVTLNIFGTLVELGEYVYTLACQPVPTGWYFRNAQVEQRGIPIYRITDGYISGVEYCTPASTTTSTTTMSPNIPECCGILVNNTDGIYFLNTINTNTLLNVSGYDGMTALGIANTANKLWSVDTQFNEWDIATTPFSATFNRNITFPGSFTISSGIVGLNDTTLIAVNDTPSPKEVVEIDVTNEPATMVTKFTLQVDRTAIGTMMYTFGDKLLIINQDDITSDYYLSQYNYSTGALELEIDISVISNPVGLIQCNFSMLIIDADGMLYAINLIYPYQIVGSASILDNAIGTSQSVSCVTSSFQITTTTTTTLP